MSTAFFPVLSPHLRNFYLLVFVFFAEKKWRERERERERRERERGERKRERERERGAERERERGVEGVQGGPDPSKCRRLKVAVPVARMQKECGRAIEESLGSARLLIPSCNCLMMSLLILLAVTSPRATV